MRKQVTFVEQRRKESLLEKGSGHVLMRSVKPRRNKDGVEALWCQQRRELQRGTHMNVCASRQHLKTLHFPRTIMSVPFLQHPALTTGQRRSLCSITHAHSTEHMRQLMKRHYLNVLHTCIQSGQYPTCRGSYLDHQCRGDVAQDTEEDVVKVKTQGLSKSSSRAYSHVVLPKIVKSRQI